MRMGICRKGANEHFDLFSPCLLLSCRLRSRVVCTDTDKSGLQRTDGSAKTKRGRDRKEKIKQEEWFGGIERNRHGDT